MMLPAAQALRDDGVSAAGKIDDGAEMIVQLRMIAPLAVGPREHGFRIGLQIPAGEIEKVDRLFEDPVADAANVIAPAVRAKPIRAPPEFDQRIERLADGARVEQL